MISAVSIGVAVALVAFVILARFVAGKPKKAQKWEKAEIMKQLLQLSEREDNGAQAAPPVRVRTPLRTPDARRSKSVQKSPLKVSQPIRSK
jgi:hypothetical protein